MFSFPLSRRFSFAILTSSFLLFKASSAITFKCKYETLSSYTEDSYTCTAQNLRTNYNDRTVTEVTGDQTRMSNSDVTKLDIYKQPCPYIPKNISNHLPNLTSLKISNTNLKFLIDGDLDGFTKLTRFDVSWNPIERLSRNFFIGQDNLEFISFFFCHLKVIDPRALLPLRRLDSANFQDNICISFHITDPFEILEFNEEVRDKCKEEFYKGQMHNDEAADNLRNESSSLPFIREHVMLITSFFAIISIILLTVIVRVFVVRLGNNWGELREVLV
jgi:Leucine-rich repeat (LRR) protein